MANDDVENANEEVDRLLNKMGDALERLKAVAQGRVYTVGTKILYKGKHGVVTDLNQGSEDPLGSTVDIRLDDGTQVDNVSVTTLLRMFKTNTPFFRSTCLIPCALGINQSTYSSAGIFT